MDTRLELLKEAIEAAYQYGWQDARNELLVALRDTNLRSAILEALAKSAYMKHSKQEKQQR